LRQEIADAVLSTMIGELSVKRVSRN